MAIMQPHRITGWYPDPMHEPVDGRPAVLRWWDGHAWTQAVCRWNGHAWISEGSTGGGPAEQPPLDYQEIPQGPSAEDGPTGEPLAHVEGAPGPAPLATKAPPAGTRRSSRRYVVIALAAVVALAGAVTTTFLLLRPNPEQMYLEELRAAGFGGQYSSDANAIATGQAACTRMRSGAPQSGSAGEQIAVEYFCPEFSEGFHVLKEITVAGTFTLYDSSYYSYSIAASNGTCEGTAGYGDIAPSTPVVMQNADGKVLASTTLGPGSGDAFECTFDFTLPVTEGESDYVVRVGDRGELHYTFTQLDLDGLTLSLGD